MSYTRLIRNTEDHTSHLTIWDTENPDIKKLKHTTPIIKWEWFIESHRALMLQEMELIIQPDWIDSVTHEIIRMDGDGDIKRRIEDILNNNS
jgi:hypothetical protein